MSNHAFYMLYQQVQRWSHLYKLWMERLHNGDYMPLQTLKNLHMHHNSGCTLTSVNSWAVHASQPVVSNCVGKQHTSVVLMPSVLCNNT